MNPVERILEGAEFLYRKHGVKSVTMDDVATHLGMSKKTIYQHFPNKQELVQGVTQSHFAHESCDMDEIKKNALDSVHEVILILGMIRKIFEGMNPSMIFDVQKFYPKTWELFRQFKYQVIEKTVRENLERGIREGLYREGLDILLISKLRVEQIDMAMNPEIFPPSQFNLGKVQMVQTEIFLHGLVTQKGKKLISKYLQQNALFNA